MEIVITILYLFCVCTVLCLICKPTEVYDSDKSTCLTSCDRGKIIFQQNCITTCPINTRLLFTGIASFCHFENEFICHAPLCEEPFSFCYKANCLKQCPEYTVEYNNTCLMQCPEHSPFIFTLECNDTCKTERHTCVDVCPSSHQFTLRYTHMTKCVAECPELTVKSTQNKSCITKCPLQKLFLFNRTCFVECPKIAPYIIVRISDYNEIYSCVEVCPNDYVYDNGICVKSCPTGKHLFNNTCLSECPDSYSYLYSKTNIVRTNIKHFGRADFMCVDDCNSHLLNSEALYFIYDKICVNACPPNAQYEMNEHCIKSCPDAFSFLEVKHHGIKCLNECTILTSNKTCVDECPQEYPNVYNNTCVETCPEYAPLMNRELGRVVCTDSCPVFYDISNKLCIFYCDLPKVVFNNSCSDKCPSEYPFIQEIPTGIHTKECVSECKSSFYQYNFTCVSDCPTDARYISNVSCVQQCTKTLPYKFDKRFKSYWWQNYYNYKYLCVESCPIETYTYNHTCVYECPIGFRHLREKTCLSTCPPDYQYVQNDGEYINCLSHCPLLSLQSKRCVNSCPQEAKFNFNGTCTKECGEYLYESLREPPLCVQSCPFDTYLLQNKTCVSVCPVDTKFHYQNVCLDQCKPESPFVYENISRRNENKFYCVTTCPTGTLYSNMTCVNACTDNKFILNNSCVFECPHTHPMKYTNSTLRVGKSKCVQKCPKETYVHNQTCFDQCPDDLSIYNMECRKQCPDSLPFRDSKTGSCVEKCQDSAVIYHGRFCETKCKEDTPYLENQQCIPKCSSSRAVYVNSSQGTFCKALCPFKMILDFDSKFCHDKCSGNKLIIENSCKNTTKCPPGTHVMQSSKGMECRECPADYYIDGKRCVKYCSAAQAMIGRTCTSFECPPSHPLQFYETETDLRAIFNKVNQSFDKPNETLLSGYRKTCYHECPENYVANGSFCIPEFICYSWEFKTYKKRCFQHCPEDSVKYKFICHPIKTYYILTAVFSLILIIAVPCFCCLVCYKSCPRELTFSSLICFMRNSSNEDTELRKYQLFSNNSFACDDSIEESTV